MSPRQAAVVTGGGGDIGRAISLRLAAAGWPVVVCDQDRASATATAELVAADGGTARAVRADVTVDEEVRRVLAAAAEEFGGIGALVNNAGIEGAVRPLPDYPEDAFERVMRVNVHSVFVGMRAVLPYLLAAGTGAIVNTASTSAIRGRANLAGYVASKHAVLGLTRVAALESVGTGVRVNAVLPGPVEGRMIRAIEDQHAVRRAGAAPHGRPDDVAAAVAYLVSPDARHVNGAAWVVDGGSTIA